VNPWVLVTGAAALLIGLNVLQKEIFNFSALAAFFGAVVWLGLHRRVRVFDSRVFYWISRLSFGMYLNHEYMGPWIVVRILPRLPFANIHLLSNVIGVGVLTVSSASVALVTFCLVEHPFLQLRKSVLKTTAAVQTPSDLAPVTT
jgi:peptidoglycan/LPS O-acetylase OafA/YrhL